MSVVRRIKYKKSRLRLYLVLMLVWFILLVVNILYVDSSNWTFWVWIFLPLGNIALYGFEYFNQYLKIENGFIYKVSLFPKKVDLSKVQNLKKLSGDYILETDHSKLRINTTLIDSESLKDLDKALASFTAV